MARVQVLRALQRLPAGVFGQESFQALRAFSTGENALLSNLQGKKEDGVAAKGFGFRQMPSIQQPFSLAVHMSTLANSGEHRQAVPEVPKAPSSLIALPPRKASLMPTRSMGHGHAMSAKEAYLDHIGSRHPYHVLPPSPWPILASGGVMVACLGMTAWFHAIPGGTELMMFGLANTLWTSITWWRDCVIEGDMGMHSDVVRQNLISGMWCFIVSEAALFVGLLWSCIHMGIAPSVHVQMQWPPVGIEPVGWDKRALVMSAVLAASYYSANVAMVARDPKMVMGALATTIGLGFMFLADQWLEYKELPFTITDSPYGTTFFITTGFHGMHVLLGAIFLACAMGSYARTHKSGVMLKSSVLYWHFVDIVWIAVYGIIYVGQY